MVEGTIASVVLVEALKSIGIQVVVLGVVLLLTFGISVVLVVDGITDEDDVPNSIGTTLRLMV